MGEEAPGIEYLGVRVEAEAVHQMRGDRSARRIARKEIQSIGLRVGSIPTLPLLLGAVLGIGLGVFGLATLTFMVKGVRHDLSRWGVLFAPCSLLGGWCLLQCIHPRTYLAIYTQESKHLLVFGGHPSPDSLEAFCAQVKSAFGYEIQRAAPKSDPLDPKS